MNKVIDAASMNVPPSADERSSLTQHDDADDFRCTPPVRYPLLVVISAFLLAALFLCGLFAEQLAPTGYAAQDLASRLSPPVWLGGKSGLLGTDFLGRDILSRLLYAVRISLLVAFAGTLISCTLGTILGFLAAHRKGWTDEIVMMLVDFQASMPFVLIALAILAFLGNSLGLFIAVMGLNGWERFARFTRGLARSASARGYVAAVRAMGASPLRIYLRHILPNIAGVLIVQFTLNFPSTVLLESSLSFLGLGIQPPLTSLGAMLGEGRNYLINAWWISVAPGTVIFCVTLSACILGDWLRDRLDPTLR
ncbi:ABC transporter permease [uncultured Mailhella sp.]|uniref:ABC transporter permease n=1 Tax=uncultured Mailhella sp. TaxID=1981031 RepID=UPI0025FBB098|nr:ABC transporter permease [uncultured Mailhella sp.]